MAASTNGHEAWATILHERAVELARPLAANEELGEHIAVLEFVRGKEHYGLEMGAVEEVHAAREITAVPAVPGFVLGIIAVRGRICSVIDLAQLFGSATDERLATPMAIILQSPAMEFAVAADEVIGMRRLAVDDLQAQVTSLTGVRQQYLRGVTRDRVAVLDAARLLGDESLIVRQRHGVVR